MSRWIERLHTDVVHVCPECDAYALGVEHEISVLFYSFELAAFATVHDWDWWNQPVSACDTRSWPDFGCVTLSEDALRSAIELATPAAKGNTSSEYSRCMLGQAAGFPGEVSHETVWQDQLQQLKQRVARTPNQKPLEQAVRALLLILHRTNRPGAISAAMCSLSASCLL